MTAPPRPPVPGASLPAFPWLPVVLVAFWCAVIGVILGASLVLPPLPRGVMRLALFLVLALALGRAVWALRRAIGAWTARVVGSAREGRNT